MAKLGLVLSTGRTGEAAGKLQDDGPMAVAPGGQQLLPEETKSSVRPQRFKTLVGRGHAEFSSSRQQVWEDFSIITSNFADNHVISIA